ncbi:uncharacterized protein G2W53_006640 [Senna tora]|uniref:Uncharacterized protein n=1 Tax=Senna tora TaxID=362788 RepID=A0A834X4P4_9FABA|nr:uncharacterized protein G2W53_006640 [Senna tora]
MGVVPLQSGNGRTGLAATAIRLLGDDSGRQKFPLD